MSGIAFLFTFWGLFLVFISFDFWGYSFIPPIVGYLLFAWGVGKMTPLNPHLRSARILALVLCASPLIETVPQVPGVWEWLLVTVWGIVWFASLALVWSLCTGLMAAAPHWGLPRVVALANWCRWFFVIGAVIHRGGIAWIRHLNTEVTPAIIPALFVLTAVQAGTLVFLGFVLWQATPNDRATPKGPEGV